MLDLQQLQQRAVHLEAMLAAAEKQRNDAMSREVQALALSSMLRASLEAAVAENSRLKAQIAPGENKEVTTPPPITPAGSISKRARKRAAAEMKQK